MNYCNNQELKDLLTRYNEININDTGEWLIAYTDKANAKYKNGTITKEQYDMAIDFVNRKSSQISDMKDKWNRASPEEKNNQLKELDAILEKLVLIFQKIANGRINSYKLYRHDDLDDIRQEAVLAAMKYCNRYDTDSKTSAFAYLTSVISNAIQRYVLDYDIHKSREIVLEFELPGDNDDL